MNRRLFFILLAGFVAVAQHDHHAAENTKPAELLDGLGAHKHPIATESKPAQRFFDQGLALIYGFNHDEAARYFRRAVSISRYFQ